MVLLRLAQTVTSDDPMVVSFVLRFVGEMASLGLAPGHASFAASLFCVQLSSSYILPTNEQAVPKLSWQCLWVCGMLLYELCQTCRAHLIWWPFQC